MVSPGNGARSDREHQAGETAVMTDAGAGESADAGEGAGESAGADESTDAGAEDKAAQAAPDDGLQPPLTETRTETPTETQTETPTETQTETPTETQTETQDDPLAQALEQARAEVEQFRDMALRAEAEMQNLRKRTLRDIEHAHKFGLERFLENLLPVVDGLEKAIEASEAFSQEVNKAGTSHDPITEGVRLCHKLLIEVLAREKVVVIDPLGEPFDPNEHQAMSLVENPDIEPNSVFAVVQKGYKLNERLVRPAMVMVSKPATNE